eukprot:scaffold7671_cov417-Prasinococcus_capsulatus_cf.AAC.7
MAVGTSTPSLSRAAERGCGIVPFSAISEPDRVYYTLLQPRLTLRHSVAAYHQKTNRVHRYIGRNGNGSVYCVTPRKYQIRGCVYFTVAHC